MTPTEQSSQRGSPVVPIGVWQVGQDPPAFSQEGLRRTVLRFREPAAIVRESSTGRVGVCLGGTLHPIDAKGPSGIVDDRSRLVCLAVLPGLYPEWLGDRSFAETHGVRFPYVAGAMARGIGSTAIVEAMSRAGMIGFFGSAGLDLSTVEQALARLEQSLGPEGVWGCNLIHSPNEPELEGGLVDLLLRRNVRRVSALAFMGLTPALVRYAASGLDVDSGGRIIRRHVFAKISRPEVARHFMSPAPPEMLDALVRSGQLTTREAMLAAKVPLAQDITVESDSGGHTDNQTLTALFPTILRLRDDLAQKNEFAHDLIPIRVGAAGGLGTPAAVAAAFSLGAAYVLTGSVNQSSVEAGVSAEAKSMLAEAQIDDVAMAASADMFELGVKVQVLKRSTLFASRANRLYELYKHYDSLESLPESIRTKLEEQMFRDTIARVWESTSRFFADRNPREIEKAARDPRHKMALVFRWYLGKTSRWPIDGESSRRSDYQLWCGPAMGAFNTWVQGSFLQKPEQRGVVQIALNLLEGAACITRAHQLRSYGAPVPATSFEYRPRPLASERQPADIQTAGAYS